MEKDLPKKDQLEKFLKDSLESYAEHPPESVWDDISIHLPENSTSSGFYQKLSWWTSGVAALFLILLVYQQFHFGSQIKKLEAKIEGQASKIEADTDLSLNQNESSLHPNIPINKGAIEGEADLGLFDEKNIRHSNESNFSTFENFKQQGQASANPPSSTRNQPTVNSLNLQKDNIISNSKRSQNLSPIKKEVPDSSHRSITKPIASTLNVETFDLLNKTQLELELPTRNLIFEPAIRPTIKPLKERKLALEAFFMPGKLSNSLTINLPADIPYKPRELSRRQVNASNSVSLGLNLAYKIGARWSIYSGLNFQKTQKEESHQLLFKRKERMGHTPGRTGTSRDYQYDYNYALNTSSGQVNMQLKMVQTNTDVIPGDEQSFELVVNTEEKSSSWSLPLFLEYKLGNGRIKPFIRGGFLAHFHLKNDFQVKQVSSADKLLKQRSMAVSKGLLKYQANTRLDYFLGMGLAYDLNERWQIQLSSSYLASLTDTNKHPIIFGKTENFGLTTSLKYLF